MKMSNEVFIKKIKPMFATTKYCSIATVNNEGFAHVTPIGSVYLKDKQRGYFFEKFTKNIPLNNNENNMATIMCVDDGNWFWLTSLVKGKFKKPPAIRLVVKFGELRKANDEEAQTFKRKVNIFKFTKGHKELWSDMSEIREFEILDYKPVFISKMTSEQFK